MDIGASSGNGGRPWKSIVWQAHGNIIPTIEWYVVIVLQWLGLLGLPSTLTSSLTLYGSAVIALCTNTSYVSYKCIYDHLYLMYVCMLLLEKS